MIFMKPVLHINAGVGWSATKPLCDTLSDIGYAICPNREHTTECNVLYYLYEREYNPKHANIYWHKDHKKRGLDFVKKDTTLDWYVDYIKSHIVKSHKGVSDFSNSNGDLPAYFLRQIAPRLESEFDVKVTTIWRNPVRRSYSQMSTWYKEKWNDSHKRYSNSLSYWRSNLEKPSIVLPDYVTIYKNWSSAFKKVYPVIMEEVWENPKGLSDFLGVKIDKMSKNLYFPERGTRAPHIKGLEHQWSSDLQDLSKDDLIYGRKKLNWLYEEFEKQFGYIPHGW